MMTIEELSTVCYRHTVQQRTIVLAQTYPKIFWAEVDKALMCSPRAVKMIGDVVVVIYVGDGLVQCCHYKRSMVFQGLVSSHVIFSFKFTKVCKYVLKTGVGFEEPVNEKQVHM